MSRRNVLEKVKSFWRERLDVGKAVLSRGVDGGELPPNSDIDLLLEVFLTPIYLRVLFSHAPVTGDFLDHLIDLLFDGAAPRASPR